MSFPNYIAIPKCNLFQSVTLNLQVLQHILASGAVVETSLFKSESRLRPETKFKSESRLSYKAIKINSRSQIHCAILVMVIRYRLDTLFPLLGEKKIKSD